MLVRTRRDSRGLARRALQQELRRKGVGDEEAAAALESVTTDDEVATAEALVAKRLPSTDRKSTRLNSSHSQSSYAVFGLKKKTTSGGVEARGAASSAAGATLAAAARQGHDNGTDGDVHDTSPEKPSIDDGKRTTDESTQE